MLKVIGSVYLRPSGFPLFFVTNLINTEVTNIGARYYLKISQRS